MEDEKLQEIYSAIDADDTMSDAEKTEAKAETAEVAAVAAVAAVAEDKKAAE